MGRKSAQVLRMCVAIATWGVLAVGTLALGGTTGPARQLERRIEEHLRAPAPPPPSSPKETHESPSIEPWELVSV
jgi:hypothetical protein